MSENAEIERIQAVKSKYQESLLQKKNVVGVGVGFREREGQLTDEQVLTVMVRQKEDSSELSDEDLIPPELDGVPVDVKEVGTLRALPEEPPPQAEEASTVNAAIWSALRSAVEAKRRNVSQLFKRKNVVACGVGFREVGGQPSDEPCVVVSVSRKLPRAQLAPEDVVPQSLDSVKTDVREVGVIRAWQLGPKDRHRPAIPGISCGHVAVSAGTIGCLVRRGGDMFILSNNHVLANVNQGAVGDPILQPGRFDGGTLTDQIAVLEQWIPLQMSEPEESECAWARLAVDVLNGVASAVGSDSRVTALSAQAAENRVDCAIARPLSPDLVLPGILQLGIPKGVRPGTLGMAVQKMGRTTGYTTGSITQVDVTVQVDYHGKNVTFVDQFVASPMSSGGDSGAAVLDMGGYVVGLLFAGSDLATLINPIQSVLNALSVELVTA